MLLLGVASVQTALDLQEVHTNVPPHILTENPDHAAELDTLRRGNERLEDLEAELGQLQNHNAKLAEEVERLRGLLQDNRATEEALQRLLLLEDHGRAVLAEASRVRRKAA